MRRPHFHAICTGFILSFSIASFGQSAVFCQKHLGVSEASKESWAPGVVQNNSAPAGGVIYSFSIKVRKSGDVMFRHLLIDNALLPVEVIKDGNRNATGPFRKGDTLRIIARSDKSKPAATPDESIVRQLKKKKAEAALLYTLNDKEYLRPISTFALKRSAQLPQ